VFRSSRLALTALFAALAAALGFAGAWLPNIELVTLTVFLGGVVTGALSGFAIGVLAELVFSMLNPLGPALPLVFVAQLIGMGIAGAAGGLLGPRIPRLRAGARVMVLAAAGLAVTLIFDVLTNLALGIHLGPVLPTLAGGLVFSVVHLTANTLAFAVLGAGGIRVFEGMALIGAKNDAEAS
jgi:energy-coupling factor transport system substrate-specific component